MDKEDSFSNVSFLSNPTHYIIATPTDTHTQILTELFEFLKGKPRVSILCEKPVIKTDDIHKDFEIIYKIKEAGHLIFMVNNYAFYPGLLNGRGKTSYSYYNSGGDGIAWDCIQLIHMARGVIELSNDSPFWKTQINGTHLIQDYISAGYVEMVDDFITDNHVNLWNFDDILSAHKKVIAYEIRNTRNPGKNRKPTTLQ
jgi:hypothetical protein